MLLTKGLQKHRRYYDRTSARCFYALLAGTARLLPIRARPHSDAREHRIASHTAVQRCLNGPHPTARGLTRRPQAPSTSLPISCSANHSLRRHDHQQRELNADKYIVHKHEEEDQRLHTGNIAASGASQRSTTSKDKGEIQRRNNVTRAP
ncbi:hypothetical protein CERZMDRAFT_81174 [Cercospora zeae-maydis SCOH1-5]|uniref:Uncharacterized protein n=1 Tax=Cercospora zeae-maydis SCOH1-5 TaxID=717836 RepID=A0A6A6FV67_9PEZI|nr:hypothetical protein CERZMDRAFT_81174 [Cercospora zeae-maydis SCOH1-5]